MITKFTMEYISIDDICDQFGKHISDYSFVEMAENGGYIFLDTTVDFIEELEEDIRYFMGTPRGEQYKNTLDLVRYLREQEGIDEGICVYVCW